MILNIFILFIFSAVISALLINFNNLTVIIAAILSFVPLLLIKPNWYFVIFILTRPVMDTMARFKIANALNLAAAATIIFIGIGSLIILRKENIQKIKENKFLMVFNKIFILFITLSLLSLLNTKEIFVSLTDFIRFVSVLVGVNYAVIFYSEKEKSITFAWMICLSSLIPLGLGLSQYIFKSGVAELGFNRISGTFLHPNVFAQYLVIVFLSALYILTNQNKKDSIYSKIFIILILFFSGIDMLLTYTRGAWIALTLSLMIYAFVKTSFSIKIKYILLGLVIISAVFPLTYKRFSDMNETRDYKLSSWQWRLRQWQDTNEAITEHPFIGYGMGMHDKYFKIMAHNDYLRIAFETGIPNLLVYLALLSYMAIYSFIKMLKANKNSNGFKFGFCFVLSVIVMSFADNLAGSTVIMFFFFTIIAALLGNAQKEEYLNENTAG